MGMSIRNNTFWPGLMVSRATHFVHVDRGAVGRGKGGRERRGQVKGRLAWESEADQSLLSIYQNVSGTGLWGAPPDYGKPVVRLRVGGRNQEEAISNWYQCARVLRTMKGHSPE